jgi:hypothetical protein
VQGRGRGGGERLLMSASSCDGELHNRSCEMTQIVPLRFTFPGPMYEILAKVDIYFASKSTFGIIVAEHNLSHLLGQSRTSETGLAGTSEGTGALRGCLL